MILGNRMSITKICEYLDKLQFTLFKAIALWVFRKICKYLYLLSIYIYIYIHIYIVADITCKTYH